MFLYFVLVWLVLGALITAVGAFLQGYNNTPEWTRHEELSDWALWAFGWPFILFVAIGYAIWVAPFVLLRKLGELARKYTRQ